jgi:D-alanyl-D-alanine carboxypeptidase
MPSFTIRRVIGACLVASAASSLAAPAQASMIDQIIFKKCSQAMADDFQKAGKTPPDGMVADTCNCVVEQVGKRQSIEQAKTFCSKQSIQKYGQP